MVQNTIVLLNSDNYARSLADHTMGIIPFLRNVLFMPKHREHVENKPVGCILLSQDWKTEICFQPKIEIYGPAGIRTFVRSILKMTLTSTGERYVVHELLNINDEITSCTLEELHTSECAGKNIRADRKTGFWTDIYTKSGLSVDAGPIEHRGELVYFPYVITSLTHKYLDPCIGYVIRESAPRYRKIVVLGDTYDASAIVPLCLNPSPSLVVHEATDAYISSSIDPKSNRGQEDVHSACIERGHSTPMMAGAFAKIVGARQLVLNHIGARFPAPQDHRRSQIAQRVTVMKEIERQASEAWGMGQAQVAVDFMKVEVSAPEYNDGHQYQEYYRGEAGYRETEGYHRENSYRRDEDGHRGESRNRSGYRESSDWTSQDRDAKRRRLHSASE